MDTKQVKNISGESQTVVGIGIVAAGDVVSVPADFHNANFEAVEKKPITPKSNKKDEKDTETA